MGTQDQARSLMMRHRHTVKNRQQSLLNRVADEVGIEPGDCSTMQGTTTPNASKAYARSNAALS